MPLKSLLLLIGAGWIVLGSIALGPGLIIYPLAWTLVAISVWGLHCLLGERISGVTAKADLPSSSAGGSSKTSAV